MNTMLPSAGAARPTPRPRAAGPAPTPATTRRLLTLAEIVRDLAGWTLPAYQPGASQQPQSWQLA